MGHRPCPQLSMPSGHHLNIFLKISPVVKEIHRRRTPDPCKELTMRYHNRRRFPPTTNFFFFLSSYYSLLFDKIATATVAAAEMMYPGAFINHHVLFFCSAPLPLAMASLATSSRRHKLCGGFGSRDAPESKRPTPTPSRFSRKRFSS